MRQKTKRLKHLFVFILVITFISISCKNTASTVPSGYQGQGANPIVSTKTKPIQRQWKGTWSFQDSIVFFDNQFQGARLNGVAYDGDNHYTLLITAENTPINPSPWYAFKVWANKPQEVVLQLTYQNSRSRYYPKISKDGLHFNALDSTQFKPIGLGEGAYGLAAAPEAVEITLQLDQQPTWISAQELYASPRITQWVDSLAQRPFISKSIIGKSREGRDLEMLEIKAEETEQALIVISRQHPPEVSGFLAMKTFVETLAGDSELAKTFRKQFTVYNMPLVNPDGVDNGHWRHNMGGIDLNRDWEAFEQPETRAIRDFLKRKTSNGQQFVFGVDFHSTWDDIYYPLDSTITGPKGLPVFDWINRINTRLPSKKTNTIASKKLYPTMVSRNHFFAVYKMPALVFELGDHTPRPFLKKKGRVAAETLMQLLLEGETD
ncbi:MAG: M14 family metallopeptidase [Bacteroidota bacterium]